MSAVDRCGAAIGDAQAYIHLSPAAGWAIGLVLIGVGILISQGLTFWVREEDERIHQENLAAEDQSLAIATKVMAPYPGGVDNRVWACSRCGKSSEQHAPGGESKSCLYTPQLVAPAIPTQRLTNGEDLLEDFGSDR